MKDSLKICVGRRKTSTARVYLKPGTGKFSIKGRSLENYFGRRVSRIIVQHPLKLVDMADKLDVNVNVQGGGLGGQAGAVQHAISRALVAYDSNFKKPLRAAKLLTRDARKVERKKVGRHKARRSVQYSKR